MPAGANVMGINYVDADDVGHRQPCRMYAYVLDAGRRVEEERLTGCQANRPAFAVKVNKSAPVAGDVQAAGNAADFGRFPNIIALRHDFDLGGALCPEPAEEERSRAGLAFELRRLDRFDRHSRIVRGSVTLNASPRRLGQSLRFKASGFLSLQYAAGSEDLNGADRRQIGYRRQLNDNLAGCDCHGKRSIYGSECATSLGWIEV